MEMILYSELNISLAECRLGVVWKESLQALSLFKTAVISHEITGKFSLLELLYLGLSFLEQNQSLDRPEIISNFGRTKLKL